MLSNSLQAWLILKKDTMSISISFILIQHFVTNEKHNMYQNLHKTINFPICCCADFQMNNITKSKTANVLYEASKT